MKSYTKKTNDVDAAFLWGACASETECQAKLRQTTP